MNRCSSLLFLLLCAFPALTQGAGAARLIGVAKVDVTPADPIRLTGYAVRKTNSIGIEQKLWAKALAIGSDADGPALLLTLDNCGIAESTYKELVSRLAKARIKQDHIAVCCSHTHSGPCTTAWAPNIFAEDIPSDHQAVIDRYTSELIDKLEQVALAALKDRRPGKLAWSQGSVSFARNRRVVQSRGVQFGDNTAGPVDQALPVLLATDEAGKVRAIVANYACHCTTIGGEFNKVCGDWAGFAQEALERDHPGAVGLISIGCGADSNPFPRGGADGGLALARQHGEEIAAEVKQLLTRNFTPLNTRLTARLKHIELPFGEPFTRAQWEERAQKTGIVGYHAKKYLARLDRGEKIPTTLSYYAQTWSFGEELGIVFLAGEVVVDYALRLKSDFDPSRLWVSGYANYVPCYIPSRRILNEGGYEAEDSLWYYDRPGRISTNAEDLIIKTVHELLPKTFLFDKKKAEFPPPKNPEQALASFRTKPDLIVDLVASEPLIESPVAIDWGADGRLWVCEMYDYPAGVDGKWKPGGRIKVLEDTNGDGHYDKATLFLDGLPFPTGLMAWDKGVLVCAAPDILYAEEIKHSGKAGPVKKLFSGFATHNYQARVNGLSWGLDGWIYGASGLFGGKIKSVLTGKEVDLSGRDFRVKPDTGEIEPVTGISQQGRIRDDFGNWFGNDNSTLLWHFPLSDHYIRRNPHVTYPDPRVNPARISKVDPIDPNVLYASSRTLERFNDPQSANRTTSACGPEIYRDQLLGTNYYGNAFICEPVHNLVHRLVLAPKGVTFAAYRAPDEQHSEFFASTDNWFRPVQVRTGPDGALWVVDMYRFVIEHPRWIPPDRLKELDPRAGADKGRIYRLYPRDAKPRPIRDLTQLNDTQLAEALNTPNGVTRDLVHRELLQRIATIATSAAISTQGLKGRNMTAQGNALGHGPENASALKGRNTNEKTRATQPTPSENPTPAESSSLSLRERAGVRGAASDLSSPLLAQTSAPKLLPAVWVQALHVLDALVALPPSVLETDWTNPDPQIRRASIYLAEKHAQNWPSLPAALLKLADDPDPTVRFQLALSLGEWKDPAAAPVLARLASSDDPWMRAAVLSSAASQPDAILKAMINSPEQTPGRAETIGRLIATAAGQDNPAVLENTVLALSSSSDQATSWQLEGLASLLEALRRKGTDLDSLAGSERPEIRHAQAKLKKALITARQLANDATAVESDRASAIRVLGAEAKPGSGVEELSSLLRSPLSPRLQTAVLSALGRQSEPRVAEKILADWSNYSPGLRPAVINLLLAREQWAFNLLDAAEQGTIASAEISLPNRQRLLKHANAAIRERSAKLLAQSSSSRAAVLANYQEVPSLTGVAERGVALFEKNCSACHAYRGHGHAVGPNLGEFAGKSVQDFLVAILDPNAAINPNFIAYNIETKDGRSLTGIVKGETASSLSLVQGGGIMDNILRGDIQEIRASQVSLMPEGLEQAMRPQELADLVAWIKQSAQPPFGSANPEQARRARESFLKEGRNDLAKIVFASEQLEYPSWMGRLVLYHCRQTDGHSKLTWKTSPVPTPLPPNSLQTFRFPAAMGFISQPAGKFQLDLNGKNVLDFDVVLGDQTWESPSGKIRMLYSVMENNSEDSNGLLLIEVPNELLEPGKPAAFEIRASAAGSQRWFGIYDVPPTQQAAGR